MKRPEGRTTVVILIVAAVLMVPVLYVLSVGPACYLFKTGRISEGTVVTAYYPIIWLAQENEMVGDWAGWYEALWSP